MAPEPSEQLLLNEAFERVHETPENPDALLQLAINLIRQSRFDDALEHARRAIEHAESDWPKLESLGRVLFSLGEFKLAYGALVLASHHRPLQAESLRILAALFRRNDEPENERRCMATIARLEAVVGPRNPNPDLPQVLRLRSFEKSRYGIKTDRETGLKHTWLKGGHFSDSNLIDLEKVNLYIATVFGNNLEEIGELPEFDLFVNAVSCPDFDPAGLDHIEAFVKRFPDVPVINPPDKVRQTTRAENARRLNDLPNVRMPQTQLFFLDVSEEVLATKIEESGLDYPMIVRHRGTQTGKTLKKVDTREDLVAWLLEQPRGTPLYASEFVDCRGKDGLYHKIRAFFIDGEYFPVANLTSDSWQIHSGDRYRLMSSTPSAQEDEKAFLEDAQAYLGEYAFEGLHAIRDAIGLDFFGIDFSLDANGKVLVFEANAAMRHNYDHAENFPYTRPHLERISQAFAGMVENRAAKEI